MLNVGIKNLNQVMDRWAANFRAQQAKQVLNETNIYELGIFNLEDQERALILELNQMLNQLKGNEKYETANS